MTAACQDVHMEPSEPPVHMLSLTRVQERQVRNNLDERLRTLERDERKHTLGPLSTLISRLASILQVILIIPAREPWNSTRVAYFLSYTSSMIGYITALPLIDLPPIPEGMTEEEEEAIEEEEAGKVMRSLLDLLQDVERGWIAVLRSEGWTWSGGGQPVPIADGGTVDQTSRVRLRSMVDTGREKFLAWARPYGNFGGEIMGPDGDEGEEIPPEELEGWEAEVVNLWSGVLQELAATEATSTDG